MHLPMHMHMHLLPLLLLVLLLSAAPPWASAATQHVLLPTASGQGWVRYNMDITLASDAPDCFERPVLLVNGMHSPALIVTMGTHLNVSVTNHIPASFPSVSEGVSIHWHGFSMHGEASWYDGVVFADMCPIAPGTSFTYSFLVDTPPGTYLWHDHSSVWKGDGLQGPLIVLPPEGASEPWRYDAEYVVMVQDWWHTPSNVLAMRLNRPYDSAKASSDSGAFGWVDMPQSLLINGRGYCNDCQPGTPLARCSTSLFTVPPGRSAAQPWATETNPGCTHETFVVQPGGTYRFRLIGGTELLYTTLCFEGHAVQVVAADGVPLQPFDVSCVDVNVGQRYDVLLTANYSAGSSFWISVHQQYRPGAPSGYAVLQYASNASGSTVPPPPGFPSTPTPQSGSVPPWSSTRVNQMTLAPQLLSPLAPSSSSPWALYLEPSHNLSSLRVPALSNRRVRLDITQPLLNTSGALRWALNNIAMPSGPVCEAYRSSMYRNPNWLRMVSGKYSGANQSSLSSSTQGGSSTIRALEYGKSAVQVYPSIGLQFVSIDSGDVVDVVLQNDAASALNGDYRVGAAPRMSMEQHPFHLHGHRFWVLGTGSGLFDPFNSSSTAILNTVNPILRDTATLPNDGWVVIRFLANNPGAWPLHCHILWHHFMGQQVHFLEASSQWTPPPRGFPRCPKRCMFNFNPSTRSWVQSQWGHTGWPLP